MITSLSIPLVGVSAGGNSPQKEQIENKNSVMLREEVKNPAKNCGLVSAIARLALGALNGAIVGAFFIVPIAGIAVLLSASLPAVLIIIGVAFAVLVTVSSIAFCRSGGSDDTVLRSTPRANKY